MSQQPPTGQHRQGPGQRPYGGQLFWFKTSPNGGVTVDAASLDDAKNEVTRRGIAYQGCGEIIGPGDDFPPGVWAKLEAQDS